MTSLLRSLLLRNRYCAPAGADGELPGGAAAEEVGDEPETDPDDADAIEGDEPQGDAEPEGETVVSFGGTDEPGDDDDDAAAEATIAAMGDDTSNAAFARIRKAKSDLKKRVVREEQEKLEAQRRTRELEDQIKALRPAEPDIDVGKEPDPDDYDTWDADGKAKFKAEHAEWVQRKIDADAQKTKRETAKQEQQQQWVGRLKAVDEATESMRLQGDKKAAMLTFDSMFSTVQRGIIMGALDKPETSALMRHALGSQPGAARALSAITDPVKFAVALGEMKAKMTVTKGKKAPPPPETRVKSGAHSAPATGDPLERLRANALKTGDMTQVLQFKKQQRLKAKQAA